MICPESRNATNLERRESEEAERRLEDMRGAWHEGRRREAVSLLDALKTDTGTWEAVSAGTKAKVLRFEAGARLHLSDDLDRAKRLADEGRALSPSDDETRVRALIASAETGADAAAEVLAGRQDADSVNLRASLLLEQGDFEGSRRQGVLLAIHSDHARARQPDEQHVHLVVDVPPDAAPDREPHQVRVEVSAVPQRPHSSICSPARSTPPPCNKSSPFPLSSWRSFTGSLARLPPPCEYIITILVITV